MPRIKTEFAAWLLLMTSFLVSGGIGAWYHESLAAYFEAQDRGALLQEARMYSSSGEQTRAQAAFEHLLDQYPNHEEVLLAYAQHLERSGKNTEADVWYARAASQGQQRFSAVRRYAGFLDRQGRAEDALRLYRDYTRNYPGDASAQLDLGLRLLEQAKPGEAIPALEAAASNATLRGEADGARGRACAALGDKAAALEAWTRAAQSGSGPQTAVYWQDVAAAHADRFEWDKARFAWQQFLAVFPDSIPALQGIPQSAEDNGAREQSARALRRLRAIAAAYTPREGDLWKASVTLAPRRTAPAVISDALEVEAAVLHGSSSPGTEVLADVLFTVRRNIRDAADLNVRFWLLRPEGEPVELDTEPGAAGMPPQWRGDSIARHFSLQLPDQMPPSGWRVAISGRGDVTRVELAVCAPGEAAQ